MFRASRITSEETLPAFGLIAIEDNESEDHTTEADTRSAGYGLVTVLPAKKYRYPVAVVFVLTAKFFEAFAANGMRTILALYLRDDLFFSESLSTIMLHVFNFFGQFCPIVGAIVADSYMGNVRTITTFYILYAFGWILLIFTSLPNLGISVLFLVSVSLLLIAIGNGSSRACVTSLGALQFQVPEQSRQLAEYFSLYYLVYYVGIFLSKLLPPMVRANTQCFNKSGCYAAVFGSLALSFFAAWLTFALGRFFYKSEKLSEENILLKFYGCIKYALVVKWSQRRRSSDSGGQSIYWLHNAIGHYDEAFVHDVGKVLKLTKLFLPLPIYFALLAQQDSSWTFQASLMNTTIAEGLTIQPDQAKAMGPIFLFLLIPVWQYICKPLIKRLFDFELKPLQSVAVGGVFSAFSFICAGILQKNISSQPYKSVNISWQIPQFVLIMIGELLLSIPGLQFTFTQAPASMKSVVTAAWFLNNAFGNLFVVLITELNIFTSQSHEFFFYATFMLLGITIYSFLAYNYLRQERIGDTYPNSSLATEVTPLGGKNIGPCTSSSSKRNVFV